MSSSFLVIDINKLYYELYSLFLKIDSTTSLSIGRSNKIISRFMSLFYKKYASPDVRLNSEMEEIVKEIQKKLVELNKSNKLTNLLASKVEKISMSSCNERELDELRFFQEQCNKTISFFYRSLAFYAKFRDNLQHSDKLKLIVKNFSDRFAYYCKDICPREELEKIFEKQKYELRETPRQCLIEFHNAMSHLCSLYRAGKTQTNKKDNQINIQRASNHFLRGGLDACKIIIKDYFVLNLENIDKNDEICKDYMRVRELEYNLIGEDDKKQEIQGIYLSICKKILKRYEK